MVPIVCTQRVLPDVSYDSEVRKEKEIKTRKYLKVGKWETIAIAFSLAINDGM